MDRKPQESKRTGWRTWMRRTALCLAFAGLLSAPARQAQALCVVPCKDVCPLTSDLTDLLIPIIQEHAITWLYWETRLKIHEEWLRYVLFQFHILPTLQHIAEQMTQAAMHQALAIGMFIDAEQQMETQRTFQRLTAQAYKDYQPSPGMCTFGTNVRSLAAADARTATIKAALDERSIKRQLGSAGVNAVGGRGTDLDGRLRQFKTRFCDRNDNNRIEGNVATGLGLVCAAAVPSATVGRDTDFGRMVLQPRTLNIDANDPGLNADEPDIFAMANYLYGHKLMMPISPSLLSNENLPAQEAYMDARAIVAKRSIAENSFHSLVSMKAMGGEGSANTQEYMSALMDELGASPEEVTGFLGTHPSYLAQLEVLSKKMYLRPGFYVDLYDKPVNVARKGVAMQAIGLMLDRDMYNSYIRSEELMSMLLEMRLNQAQEGVKNSINGMR
jgi:hypothetical protein